ncbi:unnamed protein product [Allacma fusca]|uniref:OTU domain-containing protein n=1 Tax=Allacma fusca TaxID=39272 RepID=A0A8J2JYH3_9HEXA|nr:unnamed protein product [Allacma fusca]
MAEKEEFPNTESPNSWGFNSKNSSINNNNTTKASKVSVGNLNPNQEAWLREQGLVVKVLPRHQESLFRAIAESLFLTQVNHEKVKQQVIKYLGDMQSVMEQKVRLAYAREMASKPCRQLERDIYEFGTAIGKVPATPWHAYMYRLSNGSNVAGPIEIGAISALYKCNIWVYKSIPSTPLVFGRYDSEGSKTIKLLNFYGSNHYDLLVPYSSIKSAAVCQSVVYEMLYEKVFGLQNTLAASAAALGKCNNKLPRVEEEDKMKQNSSLEFDRFEPDAMNHIKHNLLPFPLKIAKGIDPSSYRDTELDSK